MDQLVADIENVVRECAEIILHAKRDVSKVMKKSGKANFVTRYDEQVQERLRQGLLGLVPEAVFIGEEGKSEHLAEQGYAFIVDPIDGTTNFIKDYHMSCISVALLKDGKVVVGVIFNPYLNEMYTAIEGRGAWMNHQPIHMSEEPLEHGIVIFGTAPYYPELSRKSFNLAYTFFEEALDVRRSGSAALDITALAAGRAEVFFELRLSPWDYSAGSLIVAEAGGVIITFDGSPLTFDHPISVIAYHPKNDKAVDRLLEDFVI